MQSADRADKSPYDCTIRCTQASVSAHRRARRSQRVESLRPLSRSVRACSSTAMEICGKLSLFIFVYCVQDNVVKARRSRTHAVRYEYHPVGCVAIRHSMNTILVLCCSHTVLQYYSRMLTPWNGTPSWGKIVWNCRLLMPFM